MSARDIMSQSIIIHIVDNCSFFIRIERYEYVGHVRRKNNKQELIFFLLLTMQF